jgi:hypothetical protein
MLCLSDNGSLTRSQALGGDDMRDDFDKKLEQAEEDLNVEVPRNPKDGYAYSELVREAFVKIKLFRSKGFSYAQICRVFEKNGLLPKNSKPYSLRTAFQRERDRLRREEEIEKLFKQETQATGTETKPTPVKTSGTARVAKTVPVSELGDKKTGADVDERNRMIRNTTSVTVNTGTGRITKFADGSFEF